MNDIIIFSLLTLVIIGVFKIMKIKRSPKNLLLMSVCLYIFSFLIKVILDILIFKRYVQGFYSNIFLSVIGAFLSIGLTFIIRFLVLKHLIKDKPNYYETLKKHWIIRKNFKYLLSFDYLMAELSKKCVNEKFKNSTLKVKKGNLIRYFNWVNLSSILWISSIAFFTNLSCWIFKGFILYRTYSRSIEIIFAFYGDVATKQGKIKSTDLTKYDRVSLAVFSYVEMFLSYALLYDSFSNLGSVNAMLQSLGVMTLVSLSDLVSLNPSNYIVNIVTMIQVFVSLTLVLFAIASYLGSSTDGTTNIDIDINIGNKDN